MSESTAVYAVCFRRQNSGAQLPAFFRAGLYPGWRLTGGVIMLTVQHLSILHNKDLRPLISDLSFTLAGNERLAVIGE